MTRISSLTDLDSVSARILPAEKALPRKKRLFATLFCRRN
jgi:hypothetical protein